MVKIFVSVLGDSRCYDHALTEIEESKLADSLNGLAKAVAVYEPLGSQEGVISDASRGEGTRNVSLLQAVASHLCRADC